MRTVEVQLGAVARPSRVFFVGALPKTRSGKLLRRAMQAVAEGRDPGDPDSTDPNAEIKQIYTYEEPTGGFLMVTVAESEDGSGAFADFSFYNEKGEKLYGVKKQGQVTGDK